MTPDSFSDGGRYFDSGRALERAWQMIEEGAALIDVGGESTRPGAMPVSVDEELRRIVPLVRSLASVIPVPISVDTRHPEVMRAVIDVGAGMINDIEALRCPNAVEAVKNSKVSICLMHMQGSPQTMQYAPYYHNVVYEVKDFLKNRVESCLNAGIALNRLVLDPGFGFGKNLNHNLTLLRGLAAIRTYDLPLLVGVSRKSMIGAITGHSVERRTVGSVVASVLAVGRGGNIIRSHDVSETVEGLKIWAAVDVANGAISAVRQ